MTTVPGSLVWELVKKNNCFLIKQFGNSNAKVQFSKEPNNLYNVHSYKFSGLLLFAMIFNLFDAHILYLQRTNWTVD
jgi:hypothetical protein